MLSPLCCPLNKVFTCLLQSLNCSSYCAAGSRQRILERRAERAGQSRHLRVPSHLRPPQTSAPGARCRLTSHRKISVRGTDADTA